MPPSLTRLCLPAASALHLIDAASATLLKGRNTLESLSLLLIVGGVATFIGSVSQRVTGIGFALIAAPGLVIAFGPLEGILVVNICGAISSGVAGLQVLKQIDWRLFWRISISAALFIPLGGLTVMVVQADLLQVLIGLAVLVALVLPTVLAKFHSVRVGANSDLIAGGFLGYMNCVAGVGGPALIAYSVLAHWDFRSFRATAQPIFFVVGLLSFAVRLILGVDTPGSSSFAMLIPFVATTLLGSLAGALVAKRVRPSMAKALSLAIAAVGALAVLIEGLLHLW